MAKFAAVAKSAPAPVEAAPVETAREVFPIAAAFAEAEDITSEGNPNEAAIIIAPKVVVVPKTSSAPVVPAAPKVVVVAKPKRTLSNSDKAQKEFYAVVKTLGETKGKGELSLVTLALETAKAAGSNLIGETDATEIISTFQRARQGKIGDASVDIESTSKSLTQQASKLNAIIKLGLVSKLLLDNVTGDTLSSSQAEHYAVGLLERARDRHVELGRSDDGRKDLADKTTYGTLVNIARAQLGTYKRVADCGGIALTDTQIDEVVLNLTTKEDKTGLDLVRTALKNAMAARDGKEQKDLDGGGFTAGRDPIVNDNLQYAIEALDCALRELDPKYDAERAAAEKADAAKKMLIETAAQFGMTINFKKTK